VEENAPLLPRKGQRLLQFLLVGDRANPAQRIGMLEGIGRHGSGHGQLSGRGKFEQRFGGLGGKMNRQREEAVFVGRTDVGQPVGGHADREQRIVIQRRKQRRRGCFDHLAPGGLGKDKIERRRRGDILRPLANFDDLDRAGSGMRLDPPPFRPGIGGVVMVNIGNEKALVRLMHDQADIAVDPRRPEVRVLALVDPMQLETFAGAIHLQVEDARLYCLLVHAREAVERRSEGVGDEEVH
jgi:hypothetical protein